MTISTRLPTLCQIRYYRTHSFLGALAAVLVVLLAGSAAARLPDEAPPLPDPGLLGYTVINVFTAQQLVDAAWNLTDGQAIVVAPGIYDLATVIPPAGQRSMLLGTTSGPPLNDVQIRGQTGDPADVQIIGAGMINAATTYGILIFGATNVVIADLSVSQFYYSCVAIHGLYQPANIRLYHCRFQDSGQHLVTVTKSGTNVTADVSLEFCDLSYSAGAAVHPDLGFTYSGGVVANATTDLLVQDCLFHDIWNQDGSVGGPGVMAWSGASGTLVERCTFLDCTRGVALGLLEGGDHLGGIVRNNFIRWDPAAAYPVDVGISTTSPGARILHNSLLLNGFYAGIDVRYSSTTDVEVKHNLLDAIVSARDGAVPVILDNITTATPAWFIDSANGDLHLDTGGSAAMDQVSALPEAADDFDTQLRPLVPGLVDIGAAEYGDPLPVVWEPAQLTSWQYQLSDPVNTSYDVTMYDIDLFDAAQADIDLLHAAGRIAIAHFSAGTWEEWRPDADDYPDTLKGNTVDGWSGERWLDIANADLIRPRIEARLDLAAAKGFDGVEPSDVDGYQTSTGFPLDYADQLEFNQWLAQAARIRGLSVGLKNDLDQAADLEPYFDWALAEELYLYDEAASVLPFLNAGKAVFDVEYQGDPATICPLALADGISVLFKTYALGDEPPGACAPTPTDAPVITLVEDVANDQGRQVRVGFLRSAQDQAGASTPIVGYELYRRIDVLPAPARSDGAPALTDALWDLVSSRVAHGDSIYFEVVPTLADSTIALGMHWSVYFVRATTAAPLVFFDSAPDSGYSLDNLVPAVPTGLHLTGALLAWDPSGDGDFQYFSVFGSALDHLDGSATLLGHTTAVSFDISGLDHAYYHLTATDFAGNSSDAATLDAVSGLPHVPKRRFVLHPCRPNPFNPSTRIRFELSNPGSVQLHVFDASGRRVRVLNRGDVLPAGPHETTWDGRDDLGRGLPSGVYFLHLQSNGRSQTGRTLLLK